LLQSGAFGNLVGSGPGADDKATRLLEALSKGDGKAFTATTGQAAITNVAAQGNSLQAEANTLLNQVSVNTELMELGIQTMALKATKDYFGVRSPSGDDLNKKRELADGQVRNQDDRRLIVGTDTDRTRQATDKMFDAYAKSIISAGGGLISGGKKFGGDVKNSLEAGADFAGNIINNNKTAEEARRVKNNTPTIGPGAYTRRANLQDSLRPGQNAAVTNAANLQKSEVKVVVELGPNARKEGFTATAAPATKDLNATNATGNSPGR
jgi:hypothetical protein